MRARSVIAFTLLLTLLSTSCNTYYVRNRKFNERFERGQLEAAEKTIAANKKAARKKDKVIYFLNRGVVSSLLGKYAESNQFFDTAIRASEGIEKNYLLTAASFLTNAYLLPYKGESFELLLVHYYKAINYLYLRDYDAALVECRQMDNEMNELADKYKKDNHYRHDAFIHNLMGIIYDADHDYNNAFIAYRNAYNFYESDYAKLYGISAPDQLKHDLLRAAARTGLNSEVDYYEKQFGFKYIPDKDNSGELVFFWLDGLGPVKDQTTINFAIERGAGGLVTFTNSEYGWSFPFYYNSNGKGSNDPFGDLNFVRLALPKYVERPLIYTSATLSANGQTYNLQLGEDVNQIAFQSLQDRMLRELGESLLRLALKQAEVYAVRKQNQDLGTVVSLANFISEQADTRNWQTLPHSIYYSRIKLPAGPQDVTLNMKGNGSASGSSSFHYEVKAGQTVFQNFHSMAAGPALR
jgi:hypothetical protein